MAQPVTGEDAFPMLANPSQLTQLTNDFDALASAFDPSLVNAIQQDSLHSTEGPSKSRSSVPFTSEDQIASLLSVKSPSSPKISRSSNLSSPQDSARIEKRKNNTLAARRYRQKRVDQMNSLEEALKETQTERDSLKVKVARLEGEVETLRRLLRSKS